MKIEREKTNKQMMILSFIGIIMVVAGHTWDQVSLFNNIFPFYSFHMVLFVFISGYFYNDKYENNVFKKDGYIIKKIRTYLIPYFFWNIVYGLLLLLFKNMNLIDFGDAFNFRSIFIRPWIDGHQFHLNIPSWFLISLFLVNIVYYFMRLLLKKIKYKNYFLFIFLFIICIISVYYSVHEHSDIVLPLLKTGFFLFFYQLGVIYKKYEKKFSFSFWKMLLIVLIQLIILKIDNDISYVPSFMTFNCKFLITPILCGITAILFWAMISQILVPCFKDNKYVNYVSSHTKEIMFHHAFWIFAINTIFYLLSGILHLNSFDIGLYRYTIWYSYNSGVPQLSLFYTIVCLNMPLLCHYLYQEKICSFLNSKFKIKV